MEEAVKFHSQGQALFGNFSLPYEGAPCVVMSHGLEGNKDSAKWKLLAASLYDAGLASLRFNYRGCGQGAERSQGEFEDTTLGTRIQDFEAALEFIEGMPVSRSRLGAIGSSLGGTVVIASGDKRIRAVVALATPSCFKRPPEEQLKLYQHTEFFNLPSGSRVRTEFLRELWRLGDMNREVRRFNCPLLIIHGSDDKDVPVEDAHNLYEKAREPKMLKVIRGGNHSLDNPAYLRQVSILACGWLKRYLYMGFSHH